MADTLLSLLDDAPASALAIGAPDRPWMTFGDLRGLARATMGTLHDAGIGRGDRVAIVLPNGPEMAAAFVAISLGAVTAPLNSAYRLEEFDFYLSDLGARAIVLPAGYDGPALEAAGRHGLVVFRLSFDQADPAGAFTLVAEGRASGSPDTGDAMPGDVALILHTSGTTSRPKIVPLSQANIAASARHIGASLALGASDRCLNMMPLFHIHGLIAAVSASLAAGASVWCAPGFDAVRFFGWMQQARPTWYTAVPTMHQTILQRAPRNAQTIREVPLRFIRSSSASLPAQVMVELSQTFGAPVIEAYGMTEAAHQMASNPLPPRAQRPGSVGVAAGPEVRIAHETENRLVPGATGEVVISGANVTPGYEGNPEANAKSFFECEGMRWFRTGDQGAIDAEGYLSLTGRLKEIINRGGEKISPLEVDGILMDHPAVQQVVTFAVPHAKLGEEVAAAVVLRDGMEARRSGDPCLCRHATGRLQGAAAGGHRGRDPQGRHGKAATYRAGRETWPDGGLKMRICIFGAGAIGGYMGAKLAQAGADVSLVARGPHLAALQARGLTLIEEGESRTVPVRATDDPRSLGPQDYVILTLKAHSVPPVVGSILPLLGPDSTLVSGVNGVPWWYFHKLGGPLEGTRLATVDPGDVQWNGFGPDRVLGCVVYPAAEVVSPGVVRHVEGNRFSLGEPGGEKSARAMALAQVLGAAGLKAPVRPRLRDEIWVKLWGNLSFNPISALTLATLDVLCTDPGTRAVARAMMVEAQVIAEALGVTFPIDVDRRIDGGAAVGAHRTSMLQDLEAGRPMEIDALVASVAELGRLTGTPTPSIDAVLALVRLRARTAGLYPA